MERAILDDVFTSSLVISHSFEDELGDNFPGWIIYIIVTGGSSMLSISSGVVAWAYTV